MSNIPFRLYRGDADPNSVRDLKKTLHFKQLQTNLLKGGLGHAVFHQPLLQLVANHVDPGWATTHFLSFSEDSKTAFRFGMNCPLEEVDSQLNNYLPYFDCGEDWDFAYITIDTSRIQWRSIGNGIYHGSHEPTFLKFKQYPGVFKLLLINVAEAVHDLREDPLYSRTYSNALRDKEWLLLPATEVVMNTGKEEFSGILDGYCIEDFIRYKKN